MLRGQVMEYVLEKLVGNSVKDCKKKMPFVGEVYVERTDADARRSGDLVGGGPLVTSFLKKLYSCLNDLFFGLFATFLLRGRRPEALRCTHPDLPPSVNLATFIPLIIQQFVPCPEIKSITKSIAWRRI